MAILPIKDLGELDRRITIQQTTETVDSYGQMVRTYSTLGQFWAKVDYVSGVEGEDSNRLEAAKRVEFVVRYNASVNEKQLISWDGDSFEIEAVLPVERKRFMHLITRLVD